MKYFTFRKNISYYVTNIIFIIVFTDLENKRAWKQCLSVSGVHLPTGYYFGISAATGDLSDNHDVIGIRFYQLDTDVVSSY